MNTPSPSATPDQIRGYMSDMLSQLADLAKGLSDLRLEHAMRLLALEALVSGPSDDRDRRP